MTRPEPVSLTAHALSVQLDGRAVFDGVDLTLRAGELVALSGPSGAGKTLLARALVGLGHGIAAGRVVARGAGVDLDVDAADPLLATIRGRLAVYVPQDAPAALDPLRRLGEAVPRAWLARVGLPAAAADAWPHTLSGGEATRALLAAALSREAPLLLADEPLAGLDPWAAAAIVELLTEVAASGVGVLWITHHRDLTRAAHRALRLADGRLVEDG
jgi:ABC-type glutathione transport system ATPase component